MKKPSWLLLLGCVCLCPRLLACGPGELPAFANPPPDDAGIDAGDGEDAGGVDGADAAAK